ncbi:transposase [Bradyrhizobium sp. GM0.4]
MRFVEPKSEEQQARAVLFRARKRLVHQRTDLVNALRAVLYEFGHIIPQGIEQLKRLEAILEDPSTDLLELVREQCWSLIDQIAYKAERINAKTEQLKKLAARTGTAKRLQTMPGSGPLTALVIEAFAPDMTRFKRGRDFAAWLGLVPRQHSSGGKERLGRVSTEGQADIRQLLIVGAMSRLNWLGRKSMASGSWLAQMLARKPRMLVAIALANKMARTIWAMLTRRRIIGTRRRQ